MWVFEEQVDGQKLTEVINTKHENPKYLPGVPWMFCNALDSVLPFCNYVCQARARPRWQGAGAACRWVLPVVKIRQKEKTHHEPCTVLDRAVPAGCLSAAAVFSALLRCSYNSCRQQGTTRRDSGHRLGGAGVLWCRVCHPSA